MEPSGLHRVKIRMQAKVSLVAWGGVDRVKRA